MSRPRILVAESTDFSPGAVEILRELGELELADLTRAELLAAVPNADLLWIRLRHRIDAELLHAATQLRAIVTPTTGLNHIDLATAQAQGVEVISLQGEPDFLKDVRATAELTLGLMLSLLRFLPAAMAHVREGGWNRDRFKGGELCGRKVGLVGFGRLGKLVAKYLHAFDAQLLVTDPHVPTEQYPAYVQPVSLEQLLTESDIVSLHVNLNSTTERFFNAACFERMKRGALFINTARGELIEEQALLAALQSGRLAGAALDVLTQEQSSGMAQHPLIQYAKEHKQLLLTPHIGGCTYESMAKTELYLAQKLAALWTTLFTTEVTQ